MPVEVQVADDRLHPPVAVPVDDVAVVAVLEQLGIEALVVRPLTRPRPDARRLPLRLLVRLHAAEYAVRRPFGRTGQTRAP